MPFVLVLLPLVGKDESQYTGTHSAATQQHEVRHLHPRSDHDRDDAGGPGANAHAGHVASRAPSANAGTDHAATRPRYRRRRKVVGCLRLWDASIGALPGHASTGPRYVLTNARQEDDSSKDVVVLRRYVVMGDPTVNLAGHIDHTVRISGSVAPLEPVVPLKLPAPGEVPAKPGVPGRTADTVVTPGETARPGEIPAPVSEEPSPDPNWLSLKASSVTMLNGSCASVR